MLRRQKSLGDKGFVGLCKKCRLLVPKKEVDEIMVWLVYFVYLFCFFVWVFIYLFVCFFVLHKINI